MTVTATHTRTRYWSPGMYLTDGRRLFRVVSRFSGDVGEMFATLEDCATLDVEAYSPGELYAMALEPVAKTGPPAFR
jgi:hypothetical protein